MLPYETVRLAVVRGIASYTGRPVIEMNGGGPIPTGDFYTYNFPSVDPGSGFPIEIREAGKVQQRETVTIDLQVMAYADDKDVAMQNALTVRDWFKLPGRAILKGLNVVVVSIGEAQNRDIAIGEEWERRTGFEVVLRATDITEMIDSDGFIEKAEVKGAEAFG